MFLEGCEWVWELNIQGGYLGIIVLDPFADDIPCIGRKETFETYYDMKFGLLLTNHILFTQTKNLDNSELDSNLDHE